MATDTTQILYVEDNRIFSHALTAVLPRELNFVRVATLGEALAAINASDYLGCLLDLNLPDSHGIETLRALKLRTEIPIIVVTGIDDDQLCVKALRLGVKEFYSKKNVLSEEGMRRLSAAIAHYFVPSPQPDSYKEILTLCHSISERVMAVAV